MCFFIELKRLETRSHDPVVGGGSLDSICFKINVYKLVLLPIRA